MLADHTIDPRNPTFFTRPDYHDVLADLRAEDLRRVVDVNIVGAFLCARQAARTRRSPGGTAR